MASIFVPVVVGVNITNRPFSQVIVRIVGSVDCVSIHGCIGHTVILTRSASVAVDINACRPEVSAGCGVDPEDHWQAVQTRGSVAHDVVFITHLHDDSDVIPASSGAYAEGWECFGQAGVALITIGHELPCRVLHCRAF